MIDDNIQNKSLGGCCKSLRHFLRLMLRRLLICGIVVFIVFVLIAVRLLYLNKLHISALYYSRFQPSLASEVTAEDISGVWAIESPYPCLIGNYDDMKNWENTRLIISPDGECAIMHPTVYMLISPHYWDNTPQELDILKKFAGKVLSGKYDIYIIESNAQRKLSRIRVICSPFDGGFQVFDTHSSEELKKYKLISHTGAADDLGCRAGILWHRIDVFHGFDE